MGAVEGLVVAAVVLLPPLVLLVAFELVAVACPRLDAWWGRVTRMEDRP